MNIYAKVENNVVVGLEARPDWFTDDGPLTDAQLIEHGYYLLDKTYPEYDPITHYITENDMGDWDIQADKVVATFTVNAFTPEQVKTNLIDYATNKRWQLEVGGLTLNGMKISTDDRSKIMISGARIKADKDSAYTTQWKADGGIYITLTAPQIIAISDAVLDHVSNLFDTESLIVGEIQSGAITTVAQIDAAFA